jgi:2-polyprenyl-3-methyl-5-hydroxy-6-metoxy-1,4-benzoquinol methylase
LGKPQFSELSGRKNKTLPLRVLISFGGEDSAGLGFAAACALSEDFARRKKAGAAFDITLIAPMSEPAAAALPGIHVMEILPNLGEHLAEYDLLITHFGMTAFEAVYARLPVLLISPTAYHERLSRNAGFFSLGLGPKAVKGLGKYYRKKGFFESLKARTAGIARRYHLVHDQTKDITSLIGGINPFVPKKCPICESSRAEVIERFANETYRRCLNCGLIYLARLNAPSIEYEDSYFFELYKKQYGKTYLEDFPNLLEMGRKRIAQIKKLTGRVQEQKLLDIGCAYGPFLEAASEAGFIPAGIEPSEDAVRYVRGNLGFSCWKGFFPGEVDMQVPQEGRFDVITLWYTVEHFTEPGAALKEIYRLLGDRGVVALSTPSCTGISGRKSLRSFLQNSPEDHFTVWSPRSCKKIFRQCGFRLRKIVVTGHHPERFPLIGRCIKTEQKNLLYRVVFFLSRLFRLGDTFEAYGVKQTRSYPSTL